MRAWVCLMDHYYRKYLKCVKCYTIKTKRNVWACWLLRAVKYRWIKSHRKGRMTKRAEFVVSTGPNKLRTWKDQLLNHSYYLVLSHNYGISHHQRSQMLNMRIIFCSQTVDAKSTDLIGRYCVLWLVNFAIMRPIFHTWFSILGLYKIQGTEYP